MELLFDAEKYEQKTYTVNGDALPCRAYLGLVYCNAPVDPIQKLNLFAPQAYYEGHTINGYSLHMAPVFLLNTVGGYMPGPATEPGLDLWGGPTCNSNA